MECVLGSEYLHDENTEKLLKKDRVSTITVIWLLHRFPSDPYILSLLGGLHFNEV